MRCSPTSSCPPASRPGTRLPLRASSIISPAPTKSACPKRANVVGRSGRRSRRARAANRRALRPLSPGAAQAARQRGPVRASTGDRFRLGDPAARRDGRSPTPISSRSTDGASTMPRRRRVSRNGDMLIVETEAGANAAGLDALEGVLELGDGQGLLADRAPGAVPRRRARRSAQRPARAAAVRASILAALARRDPRRPAAQHHALRLPDPQPQGAEPRQGRRRRSARRGARRSPIRPASC